MPTRKHITAKHRERIKTGVILDRVHKHILGELELSATQIQAARMLLNKTLPDLKAHEHEFGEDMRELVVKWKSS